MKNKGKHILKTAGVFITAAVAVFIIKAFHPQIISALTKLTLYSTKGYLPTQGFFSFSDIKTSQIYDATFCYGQISSAKATDNHKETEETLTEETSEKQANENNSYSTENKYSLTETDEDIKQLILAAEKDSVNDEKDGAISDYKYTDDGVTDCFGCVKVKNTNDTQINLEEKLKLKSELSINTQEPAVLIYHTHTTESYQLLDRDFYPIGFQSRSSDENLNMVRVGKAICEEIERAGYKVIHVTDIHDQPYSGAYSRSRATVEEYLEKYPSIQITLDIHRDAIERSDGTKIAPTAEINGKKAAQIMIISGCQEEGNGITDLPDWEYNLTFALQLQENLETGFPGITRPLFFCARSYNMNLTRCSLLVEVGSDANTLEEAVYSGKCLGTVIAEILKEYDNA